MYFAYMLLKHLVLVVLMVIETAMFIRAILSWFPLDRNKFTDFLYSLTEPFVYPFRRLFHRMNWFQDMPFDMAFFFAFITISILSGVLGA